MTQFKTELHMHTSEVSACAGLSSPEMAELYVEAGYTSVVVTNHYSPATVEFLGSNWSTEAYLEGYRAMKAAAGDRLHILLGVELRFESDPNDYLLYGVTEDFLYANPNLHLSNIRAFSPLARQNGILIVQAHPFRNSMKVRDPALLDGVEVYNANTSPFRNRIALEWARHYNLIGTSGSDLHSAKRAISAGILTDVPIESNEMLLRVLRTREAGLIRNAAIPTQTGLAVLPATLIE